MSPSIDPSQDSSSIFNFGYFCDGRQTVANIVDAFGMRLGIWVSWNRLDSNDHTNPDNEINNNTEREGVVSFEDGNSRPCSRRDIKFGSGIHHGSFGDYVAYARYERENKESDYEDVVVKVVRVLDRRSGNNDGRSMDEILGKMDVASRMNHDNVAKFYGFVIEEMTCYMLLEPMQASLAEIIKIVHTERKEKYDQKELEMFLGCMAVDLVDALSYMCSQQINTVLTPRRILMNIEGKVKIGVSSAITTEYSKPVRYSAPELLDRCCEDDLTKTGVWSLGVNLIEAATGQHPFPGSIDFVIADLILEGERAQLDNVFSHQLRTFVDKCLTQNRKERPSASEFDENCLQATEFYKHHSQCGERFKAVSAMLQCVLPHLEKFRRE